MKYIIQPSTNTSKHDNHKLPDKHTKQQKQMTSICWPQNKTIQNWNMLPRHKCDHTSRKSPAAIENWALGGRSVGFMSGKETLWVWCSGRKLFTYWCTQGNTWCTFVPRHLELVPILNFSLSCCCSQTLTFSRPYCQNMYNAISNFLSTHTTQYISFSTAFFTSLFEIYYLSVKF